MRITGALALFAVSVFAAPTSVTAVVGPGVQFGCTEFSTPEVMAGGALTTASKTYVNVNNAVITVAVGGGKCLMVEFTAQTSAKSPEAIRVRATVNGTGAQYFPADATWYASDTRYQTHSARFVIPNTQDGMRTVRIQILSVNGGSVAVKDGVLVVRSDTGT